MVVLIASIVVLAVGVHAVFASDPFYGSDVGLGGSAQLATDG